MLTDYKISRVTTYDSGDRVIVVRVSEGEITTEKERIEGKVVPVTRYRRARVLSTQTHTLPPMSDREVRRFLCSLLSKDKVRTPIPEQADV